MSYCAQICLRNENGQQIEWAVLAVGHGADQRARVDVTLMAAGLSSLTSASTLLPPRAQSVFELARPFPHGKGHVEIKHTIGANFMCICFCLGL